MRFTIIIPTLNEEAYISDVLSSLAKQTHRDFEVIIVDAHSQDTTREKVRGFDKKLPKLRILESRRKHVSVQRNIGADAADGEYLLFFDADVSIPPTFLSAIDRAVKRRKSLVLTTWLTPSTRQEQDLIMCMVYNVSLRPAIQLERPFVAGYNIIVQKQFFDHVGQFNTKISMSEDHDLVKRCQNAGVRMHVLTRPKLIMSMRRFKRYGYFSILRTYTKTWGYMLLRKSINKTMIDYPMGGHLYKKKAPDRRRYLKRFEDKLFDTINAVLRS
ncbi:glycosyltransferase family 2 protein [Patescibacteria group bacterium]